MELTRLLRAKERAHNKELIEKTEQFIETRQATTQDGKGQSS